jgi:hypothetical protein
VGGEREADQLAVLLELAADRGQGAALPLDFGADSHRSGLGNAKEVHRHRAHLPLGVRDG